MNVVLVSDTSVLIDLERGGFLDSCFKLPFVFAVPDLLYNRELADFGGPDLIARGLRVQGLTKEEVAVAQAVRGAHSKLSLRCIRLLACFCAGLDLADRRRGVTSACPSSTGTVLWRPV